MFIKLTKTDGTPVWLNPEFIVRIEPWKKGSAVAAAGDGDFEVMEDPRAILALAGGVRVAQAPSGEGRAPARPSGESGAGGANGGAPDTPASDETPVAPVVAPAQTPVMEAVPPVRKTRSRRKTASTPVPEPIPESDPVPVPEPAPEPVPEPVPAPPPTEQPASNLFPEPPDEVAVAAAILKKNRCRSRKRIENTIKSMNPKMSMADARALLQQMEARGLVLIDAQGHATFT